MEFIDCFDNYALLNEILKEKKSNKLVSGYLFYCPDSETNWQFVHSLARGLMCKNDDCKVCPDCIKVKENTHPDVLEYPIQKRLLVTDSEDISEQVIKKPMLCDKKIIIINDIDNSSEEAQNKLLKTLEEPPYNVIFLVTTTNLEKVLPTVKSRLVKKQVQSLGNDIIKNIFIRDRHSDHFDLAIKKGKGFIGKTRSILQNKNFLAQYELCENIVCNLKNTSNIIKYMPQKLDKDCFSFILENLSVMYNDILLIKLNQQNLVENDNLLSKFEIVKDEYSIVALQKILQNINDANKKQFSNVALPIILQTMLIKNLEVKYLCK